MKHRPGKADPRRWGVAVFQAWCLSALAVGCLMLGMGQLRADSAASSELNLLNQRRANLTAELVSANTKANQAMEAYRNVFKTSDTSRAVALGAEADRWEAVRRDLTSKLAAVDSQLAELKASGRLPAAPPATPITPQFAQTTFSASPGREPSGRDTPPAVLELQAARAELSKIEEFRAAESMVTRRGGTSLKALGRGELTSARREVASIEAASATPPTATVILTPGSNATVSTTARVLAPATATITVGSGTAQSNRAQIEAEAQEARARELAANAEAGRATVVVTTPAVEPPPVVAPDPNKLNPFSPGSPKARGNPYGAATAAVSPAMDAGRQRELEMLMERKRIMLREVEETQNTFRLKTRELDMAGRTGQTVAAERAQQEVEALDARFKRANNELALLDSQIQALAAGLAQGGGGGAMGGDAIQVGDALQMVVIEDPEFNNIYQVRPGGYILLPRLGRVQVQGMDVRAAEAAIRETLEATQLRVATVTLERMGGQGPVGDGPIIPQTIIYLAGEFITPGPLRMPPGTLPTLLTTIIRSGGITPSGDLTRVRLLRIVGDKGAQEEINVSAILSGQEPPMDIALEHGDIIVIPPFAPVVYVTGNVEKPGTLRLFQDETLTAYAAILRAGGFARFASLSKVYVVRDLGNGEKVNLPVNIKEVQRGNATDIILQGKDIVVVPERFFSF